LDTPARRHCNGGTLSFADGHVGFWRWREGKSLKTLTLKQKRGIEICNDFGSSLTITNPSKGLLTIKWTDRR